MIEQKHLVAISYALGALDSLFKDSKVAEEWHKTHKKNLTEALEILNDELYGDHDFDDLETINEKPDA